jgi:hypothetical protein
MLNIASKYFIYAGISLTPFQLIAIPIYGSKFDLSIFCILIGVISYKIGSTKLKSLVIIYTFFVLQVILSIAYDITPIYRFISAVTLVGSLIFIALKAESTRYSNKAAMKCTLFISLSLMPYALIEVIVNPDGVRPKALFDESSAFGLYLLAVANGVFAKIFLGEGEFKKIENFIFFVALLIFALLTKTANFISFILVFFCIIFFIIKKSDHILFNIKYIFYFIATILGILYINIYEFSDKLFNVGDNYENISLITWLRGFDQVVESIKISPLFGLGGGSTGQFDFDSIYTAELAKFNLQILNINDAYSLLFRLIIEFGIFGLLFFLVPIIKIIVNLFHQLNKDKNISPAAMFNIFFALTIIVGCLVKEPTYSRSLIFVAVFLFFGSIKRHDNQS